MENNLEILITNLYKVNFLSQKTGEVTQKCVIEYLIKKEDTPNSRGLVKLCPTYCDVKYFDELSKYLYRFVRAISKDVVIEESRNSKNFNVKSGLKQPKLIKIENVVLS